jgi:hypothetical protein
VSAIRDPLHSPIRGDVIFQPAGDGTTWVASATKAGVAMGMGGGGEELVTWETWDALCDGAASWSTATR